MFKKKSKAPRELPELAVDELKKDLKDAFSEKNSDEKKEEGSDVKAPEETKEAEKPAEESQEKNTEESGEEKKEEAPAEDSKPEESAEKPEEKKEESGESEVKEEIPEVEKKIEVKKTEALPKEKGFFGKIIEDLSNESESSSLYSQVFSKKDLVEEMKQHWQGKKDEVIIKTVGKEYKDKINSKAKKLQALESEWQELYFKLIQKEEEMRQEEAELKEIVQDFVKRFKKRGNIKNLGELKEE